MLAHIIDIRQVTSDVPLMGASVICANYFEKLFSSLQLVVTNVIITI